MAGHVPRETQAQIARRRGLIVDLFTRDPTMDFSRAATIVVEANLAGPKYSRISCMRDWRAALQSYISRESAERQRALANMRYDRLIRALWQPAMDGDTKAVDSIGRIMDSQNRLNGTNAPQRTELEIRMHIAQLSQVTVTAVAIGMDAADLTAEQRQKMLDAMRRHFHELEGRAEIVELEPVDVA